MTPAVELIDVARRFGAIQALAGVDLTVEPGEFFGLLGPNGAGKTTLISVLAGLAHADRGTARVLGHDVVADYRMARRLLGVVPQELVFDPFFTVRETLRIQAGYFGIRANDAWIDEILHHLDLTCEGRREHARVVRRNEAPRAGRAGAGAQAAGHRARRAHRGGRRRVAAEPVGVHPQAQPRWAHDHPDHALPRGSGGVVRPHRDAQGGQGGCARHHAEPAVELRRADRPADRRRAARSVGRPRAAARSENVSADAGRLRRARAPARRRCASAASPSPSCRCRKPTSSRSSCAS